MAPDLGDVQDSMVQQESCCLDQLVLQSLEILPGQCHVQLDVDESFLFLDALVHAGEFVAQEVTDGVHLELLDDCDEPMENSLVSRDVHAKGE